MISINTIHYWINKYYNNYINKIKITNNTINEYKKNNIHKSKKRHLYSTRITEYVNTNNGDSLDNICKNATDSCLSKSTVSLLEQSSNCDLAQAVCRELKELKITYKKINKYIVCKDINSITAQLHIANAICNIGAWKMIVKIMQKIII